MTEINSGFDRFETLAECYRSSAQVCLNFAHFAHDANQPHEKADWLRLAEGWVALAEQAEARR
jgi:hypothetical protein